MSDTGLVLHIAAIFRKAALVSAVAIVAALWMSPAPAHACSCGFPDEWGFIGPESGRLPANAAGVAWYKPVRYGQPEPRAEDLAARFTVEVQEGGVFRPLSARVSPVEGFSGIYVIAPEGEGLRPGATYRFTVDRVDPSWDALEDKMNPYWGRHKQVLVTVDAEKLQPRRRPRQERQRLLMLEPALTLDIGLITTEYIRVAGSPECMVVLRVTQVSVEAKLAQEAQQWREQLLYRSIIDGEETWYAADSLCATIPPGRSWEAVGHDRIYAACKEEGVDDEWSISMGKTGLEPGQHTVTMQAVLPGTDIVLETATKSVDLPCPPRSPDEAYIWYPGPDWGITVDRTCAVWGRALADLGKLFTWSGACVDGKASGAGRVTQYHGDDGEVVHESEMQTGRMPGMGAYADSARRYQGCYSRGSNSDPPGSLLINSLQCRSATSPRAEQHANRRDSRSVGVPWPRRVPSLPAETDKQRVRRWSRRWVGSLPRTSTGHVTHFP